MSASTLCKITVRIAHATRMAFHCPPEVLLRSSLSNRNNARFELGPTLGSRRIHKAAVCQELGKPLQTVEVPTPEKLEKDQVLLAVHAAAINYADILICGGQYQEKPPLPYIPGVEVSGTVVAVGEGVTNVSINDRVLSLTQGQGYAEYCVVDSQVVWRISDRLNHTKAASLLASYGTAFLALTRSAQMRSGETVLVTAAAGGLGLATVDLAVNVFGGKVIAACGGENKVALVKDRGAHHVIDYTRENLRERVKEITGGKGADVIIDPVGGQVLLDCLRCIAFEGRLITLGYTSGEIPKVAPNLLLVKSCAVMGLWWGNYRVRHPQVFLHSIESVLKLCREHKIDPYVSRTFRLDQVNEAFEFIQSRKSTGKVVLQIRDI